MNRTKIEWVKNPDGSQGYTWNPITGCLNHDNGLCKGGGFPCYAYKLAHGRLKQRYLANKNICDYGGRGTFTELLAEYEWPFHPRFWEERLAEPIEHPEPMHPVKRKGIFVCDMGELFGDWLPNEWVEQIMTTIKLCPYHRFYLLTKQPQNLPQFSPFPDNCWVGVTATNGRMVDDAGYYLEKIEAKVKFLSLEPLLEPILIFFGKPTINWLILGAQTKPYKPPEIEWVREIVEAADKAGIPVFLKDNLKSLLNKVNECRWAWINSGLGSWGLRQEMPPIPSE